MPGSLDGSVVSAPATASEPLVPDARPRTDTELATIPLTGTGAVGESGVGLLILLLLPS